MRKGCWAGIALGAVLVVGSGAAIVKIALSYFDYGSAASELPAAVAAYRATGLPFVASELVPPRPAPAEDATPAIRRALAALPKGGAKADLARAMRSFGPEGDAVATAYAPALAAVQTVVTRSRVDFGRNWDLGPNVLFPEYPGMKDLVRAATLRAVRSAQEGDDAAALRDLRLARQIARWTGDEPTLISAFTQIAAESIALDGAQRCLAAAHGRPDRIARYAAWLRDTPPLPSLPKALRGEAWMGVATGRNLDRMGGEIDVRRLRRDGLPEGQRQRALMARVLQAWTEASRATDRFGLPPIELGERFGEVSERWDRKRGLSQTLVAILFPTIKSAGRGFVTLDARRAVAAGLAEALAVQARTGRWPDAVAVLDPFTRKPLRTRVDGEGFRVWSVGRDGLDDGGLSRREAAKIRDLAQGETLRYDEVAAFPPFGERSKVSGVASQP